VSYLDEYVEVNVLAGLLKLTPRRIQQLVREGVFPKSKRLKGELKGKYHLKKCIHARLDQLGKMAKAKGSMIEGDHSARRMKAQADMAEILVQEKKQELVPVEQVKVGYERIFSVLKQKLMAMPDRLVQLMETVADKEDRRETIDSEVRQVLADISVADYTGPEDEEFNKWSE